MDLATVEEEARALVRKHVVPEYEWYERHSRTPWLWYRSLGILVILLGVAIPLLTLALDDGAAKQIVIASVGAAISIATGLLAFFGWERTWRGRRSAEIYISQRIAVWEMAMLRAKTLSTPDEVVQEILAVTAKLVDETGAHVMAESQQFFEGLRSSPTQQAAKMV